MEPGKWAKVVCPELPPKIGKKIKIQSVNTNSLQICGIKVFGYESANLIPEQSQGISTSIDIDPTGNVYANNKKGLTYIYNGTAWSLMAGVYDTKYIDVSYGLEMSWSISRIYPQSYKYNVDALHFEKLVNTPIDLVYALALGPLNDVWMILSDYTIQHFAITTN